MSLMRQNVALRNVPNATKCPQSDRKEKKMINKDTPASEMTIGGNIYDAGNRI